DGARWAGPRTARSRCPGRRCWSVRSPSTGPGWRPIASATRTPAAKLLGEFRRSPVTMDGMTAYHRSERLADSEIVLRGSDPAPDENELTLGDYDLSERAALRRVAGLSTELTDITE